MDEKKSIFEALLRFLDPVFAKLGFTKTELAGLLLFVLALAQARGWLPPEWTQWVKEHWQEIVAALVGAGMVGLRDAVRTTTPFGKLEISKLEPFTAKLVTRPDPPESP